MPRQQCLEGPGGLLEGERGGQWGVRKVPRLKMGGGISLTAVFPIISPLGPPLAQASRLGQVRPSDQMALF